VGKLDLFQEMQKLPNLKIIDFTRLIAIIFDWREYVGIEPTRRGLSTATQF
jgi:hypothetical protein